MPRPVSLSLDLLKTYILLLENDGDASRTAGQLGINQPSMSKRLRYLQHTGQPLEHPWLVREGKTWKPTEEGLRVLPAVREIVQKYRELTEFVHRPPAPAAQISLDEDSAATMLADALRQFRLQAEADDLQDPLPPDVLATPLHQLEMPADQRIEQVASGFLDLAVVSLSDERIAEIARRPLMVTDLDADPVVIVCAEQETPWSSRFRQLPRSGVTAEQLRPLPLLLPDADSALRRPFDEWLDSLPEEQRPQILNEGASCQTVLAMCRAGAGIGVVARSTLPARPEGLLVKELSEGLMPSASLRIVCRRRHGAGDQADLTACAAAWRDLLLAAHHARLHPGAASTQSVEAAAQHAVQTAIQTVGVHADDSATSVERDAPAVAAEETTSRKAASSPQGRRRNGPR